MFGALRPRLRLTIGALGLGVLVLVLAACSGSDPTATPAPTATEVPTATPEPSGDAMMDDSDSLVIDLGVLNDSGQSGTATLTAKGEQTEVVISVSAGAAGIAQPIHIHAGTCSTLGGVVHALTNVEGGNSTTTVDVSLASLKSGDFAINLHKSADEIAVYTACGNITAGDGEMMDGGAMMDDDGSLVIDLGVLNDSGQSGTATLTAKGEQTEVVVSVSPGAAGIAQPIHIHAGTCSTLGGVVHALTNVDGGASTTTVDASLESLKSGDFAINLHKSADEIAVYTACGDITAGDGAMMDDGDRGGAVASDIAGFALEDLTVAVGTTVTWTNQDNAGHTTTSGASPESDGIWNSAVLTQGQTLTQTFDTAGEFVYFCRIHPTSMKAKVTVEQKTANVVSGDPNEGY